MVEPILKARGLSKCFDAVIASDEVDLDLMPGEIHALIGPNGAGKSTLVKQLSGEMPSDAGEVILAGKPLDGLTAVGRARAGIGRSFQISSVIADFTCEQNVLLAVEARAGSTFRFFHAALGDSDGIALASECLERVGLSGRRLDMARELSHGERRRLELAMVLALRPKVFLLDEPMAGLGPEGTKEISVLLESLRRDAPILLIEHDMDVVFALADRISVLVYGKIIASGMPDEIRSDSNVQEAYLGSAI